MITAKIIEDSLHPTNGSRLTTMQLRYPRFVHAELMTHRAFSRNAASSRAIPVKKMLAEVYNDPATPVWWGANQSGMQARTELTGWKLKVAKFLWFKTRFLAIAAVWLLNKCNLHKQIANRILEPWLHIEVVLTSSKWANFYALRVHPDAQPEMRELAQAMYKAHTESVPKKLGFADAHLPYVGQSERNRYPLDVSFKLSAARCARVSYLTHDKKMPKLEEDLDLYKRLMGGEVKHASPTEHQAMPSEYTNKTGNLGKGWAQFRKTIEGENIGTYGIFSE